MPAYGRKIIHRQNINSADVGDPSVSLPVRYETDSDANILNCFFAQKYETVNKVRIEVELSNPSKYVILQPVLLTQISGVPKLLYGNQSQFGANENTVQEWDAIGCCPLFVKVVDVDVTGVTINKICMTNIME